MILLHICFRFLHDVILYTFKTRRIILIDVLFTYVEHNNIFLSPLFEIKSCKTLIVPSKVFAHKNTCIEQTYRSLPVQVMRLQDQMWRQFVPWMGHSPTQNRLLCCRRRWRPAKMNREIRRPAFARYFDFLSRH